MLGWRDMVTPWLASMGAVGIIAGVTGFCVGGNLRRPPQPAAPEPIRVMPVDPGRGDQTQFIDADPDAARKKSDPSKKWGMRFEWPHTGDQLRGVDAASPVGLELIRIGPGVTSWRPRTKEEHAHCGAELHPTGRTSLDADAIDIEGLDQGRWVLLAINYPEVIRLAQHFNAGDLVEVRYLDRAGEWATFWVHHELMLEPKLPTSRGVSVGRRRPRG